MTSGFFKLTLGAAVFLLTAAGCQTTKPDRARREQWEGALSRQVIALERENTALEGRVDEFRRRLGEIEGILAAERRESDRNLTELRSSLREEISSLHDAVNKKLDVILEEVARENERLLARIQASRAGAVMRGYEHVVKPGETISGIARHYGVTAGAIVEANQLADPHAIRVGQILFIPE